MTRGEVQTGLRGKEVPSDALDENTRAQLQSADRNGDGVIAGSSEVDRMFNIADDLDNNGKRDSVTANTNGAQTAAGALLDKASAAARTATVAQRSGPTGLLLLVSISKHETANWTSSAFRNNAATGSVEVRPVLPMNAGPPQ